MTGDAPHCLVCEKSEAVLWGDQLWGWISLDLCYVKKRRRDMAAWRLPPETGPAGRMSLCQRWTRTHSTCQRALFQISHTQCFLLAVSWLDIIPCLCRPNWWMSKSMYYDRIHLLWSAVLSYLVMLFSPPHLVHFSEHKDKEPDNYTEQLSISMECPYGQSFKKFSKEYKIIHRKIRMAEKVKAK